MEVLTDILKGLRTTGSVYFCDFLVPPWELAYKREARAMFHLVRRGHCQLVVDDEARELVPGDYIAVPRTLPVSGQAAWPEQDLLDLARAVTDRDIF